VNGITVKNHQKENLLPIILLFVKKNLLILIIKKIILVKIFCLKNFLKINKWKFLFLKIMKLKLWKKNVIYKTRKMKNKMINQPIKETLFLNKYNNLLFNKILFKHKKFKSITISLIFKIFQIPHKTIPFKSPKIIKNLATSESKVQT
jgi:hypothetical protein